MAKQKPTKTKEEKPKGEEKKKGMVEIPQSQLENILKRMDSLEKDKDMLLQIADKRQLGIYYQRHREKLPGRIMLRTVMTKQDPKVEDSPLVEKVIIGWRSTKDIMESESMPGGLVKWTEDQRCELLFEDGTSSGEISQRKFNRDYKQAEAEIIQKITNEETGDLALKVRRLDNGKEYTVGVQFIN